PEASCSPARATASSRPITPRPGPHCGASRPVPASTRRQPPTPSMASNTSSWPPAATHRSTSSAATRSLHSRLTDRPRAKQISRRVPLGSVGHAPHHAGQGMRAGHLIVALLASLMLAGSVATTAMAQTTGTESIEDKAAICGACHGADGIPASKEIPIIWGQHAGYIFLNLRDIQTGTRKNEQMEPILKMLRRGDML